MTYMRASIVVLTYNQLKEGTAPCVESLFLFTPKQDFELILVDNASSDGTPGYLRSLQKEHDNVKVILNDENKGYAAGNNDGMRMAEGECLVLLNNDTLVTPGWLDALLGPLERDRTIGMICPVTNSAGNEQMIILPSLNEENYVEVAGRYTSRNKGHLFDTEKLGFYCVAFRREVLEKVGPLDENFGIGMFEDDDYCLRVRRAGHRLVINEGCFIYHKGSLSFKRLVGKEYQELFERNREYYQSKHGVPWLFNDLTLAYFRQMRMEIEALQRRDPASLEAERIAVRLRGFQYLIDQARELEEKGGRGNVMRGKWVYRAFRMFLEEYVKGDRRSRLLFRRKVRRRLRPLRNQEVIDRLGAIRRKEGFRHLIVLLDQGDYHAGGRGSTMADALVSAGVTVLYGTMSRERDAVEVVEEVKERLYLMNQELFGFLPHLVTEEEVVYVIGSLSSLDRLPEPRSSQLIVDLTGGGDAQLLPLSEELAGRDLRALFLLDRELRKGVILPRSQTALPFFKGADLSGLLTWLDG